MSFLLSPPIAIDDDHGVCIIQLDDMEFAESMVIAMCGWSTIQLLKHWRSEIGQLVEGCRNRCCIVSGLTRNSEGRAIPSEWWKVYEVDGTARFHHQLLALDKYRWGSPTEWWMNLAFISPNTNPDAERISEWSVSLYDLSKWCEQCDVLINTIHSVTDERA